MQEEEVIVRAVWAQAMLCRMTTEAMQMVAARHVSLMEELFKN